VFLRRWGFHEGPVDLFKGFQQELEELFQLKRQTDPQTGRLQNPAKVGGLYQIAQQS
jgi:hypothetical protein